MAGYTVHHPEAIIETVDQARLAFDACIDKKGQDVRLLGVNELTTVADYFVICTAQSAQQARAIAQHIREELRSKANRLPLGIEGGDTSWWVLVDYGDFICHVFLEEARQYYAIEQTWADAREIARHNGALRKTA
jgi:ribosome-associated protein